MIRAVRVPRVVLVHTPHTTPLPAEVRLGRTCATLIVAGSTWVCVIYQTFVLDSQRLMEAQVVNGMHCLQTASARRRCGTRSGQAMRRGGSSELEREKWELFFFLLDFFFFLFVREYLVWALCWACGILRLMMFGGVEAEGRNLERLRVRNRSGNFALFFFVAH